MSYLINVIGNRCTGKSTLCKAISKALNIGSYIPMHMDDSSRLCDMDKAVVEHTGTGKCMIWQMPYEHVLTVQCDIPLHHIYRGVIRERVNDGWNLSCEQIVSLFDEVDALDDAYPCKLHVDAVYDYINDYEGGIIEHVTSWVNSLPVEATNAYR